MNNTVKTINTTTGYRNMKKNQIAEHKKLHPCNNLSGRFFEKTGFGPVLYRTGRFMDQPSQFGIEPAQNGSRIRFRPNPLELG